MERDMRKVILYWLEGEFYSFIKVWLLAYSSLCYCYFAGKLLPKGAARVAAFLPVVCLFLLLPLQLHTVHLSGATSFMLSWLASFKLLAFAFDRGPLSVPSIPLPAFVAVAALPIQLQQQSHPRKSQEYEGRSHMQARTSGSVPIWKYVIKGLLIFSLLKIYGYRNNIHPRLSAVLYCLYTYLYVELELAVSAAIAGGLLGLHLEPQFNEPYLSTSLQDFWGRRWNLVVTRLLNTTVFRPVLHRSRDIVGRRWALALAAMATFTVSGLMHDLLFYYWCRVRPTWHFTRLLMLQGACWVAEVEAKTVLGRGGWRLPRFVQTILTVGFLIVSGSWMLLPQLALCNLAERVVAEAAAVGAFVKDVIHV